MKTTIFYDVKNFIREENPSKTSILLNDIYKMSISEFKILLELYSNRAASLSTDEIKPKYYLNIRNDYDNTPVKMEACWVEHSGTLIYFVNDNNFICSKNEHQIGIDFFEEFNIFVYKGYVYPNYNLKYANNYQKIDFKIKNRNFSIQRVLHNRKFYYDNYSSLDNLKLKMKDKDYVFKKNINAMNLKLCFNGIEIGLIKDENNSIYLENVNLDNFTLIHKSNVNVEDDSEYYSDIGYYYRENIRESKLHIEIYKSNKIMNCYLLKTQNYFNIYPFNININLKEHKNLFFSLIKQNYEAASSSLQRRIWEEAREEYLMELGIERELEQKRDELFQSYYNFIEEIVYSIDKSFDLYKNFHSIINDNKIDCTIELTDERKKELKLTIENILILDIRIKTSDPATLNHT